MKDNIPVKFIKNLNKYSKYTLEELLEAWEAWGEGRVIAIEDFTYENGEPGVKEVFLLEDGTIKEETYLEDRVYYIKESKV